MDPVASRLPAVLGASSAMAVAFVSFISQSVPSACFMRAFAAFVVFSAFGMLIRALIGQPGPAKGKEADEEEDDGIEPGTSVEEALGTEEPAA